MELLGHKHIIHTLAQEIDANACGHSFLFFGPAAIGKFQAAVELAKLLVQEPGFEPSENMPFPSDVCVLEPTLVTKGKEVKVQTKQKGIPLDDIRAALQFLSRYPSKGRYRVLIIRDAHVLTVAAQNMILKTLEEPQESSVLILTTHEPGTLLPTVLSRILSKEFLSVSKDEMEKKYPEKWLTENSIPPFFRDFGRPGILEDALLDPERFQRKKQLLAKLYTITRLHAKERMDLAQELTSDVPEAVLLLEWWVLGLQTQARNAQEKGAQIKLYAFMKNILAVIDALKNTQGNARLLTEQLFFQIR